MKAMKNAVYPVIMTGAAVLAWFCAVSGSGNRDEAFAEYFQKARINEGKQAYITAAEWYAKASEIKPDDAESLLLAAENFLRCGEKNMFLKYCRMAAESSGADDRPWVLMGQYYLDSGDAAKASGLMARVPESCRTEAVEEVKKKADSSFRKSYKKFADAKPFRDGYFAVSDGSLWGLADEDGDYCILPEYEDVGAFSKDEGVVPVCSEGVWMFVNADGQTCCVPSEKYTWLGAFGYGAAPFCCDGKYGYTDLEYNESSEKYDYAGAFSDGVAAVKKSGHWALINSDFKPLTEFEYDEIEVDDYGFCVKNGTVTARKDGKTVYLDTDGKETEYEKHYSCGLAPISSGDYQGYENAEGDIVIDAFFEEVTDFTDKGRALVREDGWWKVITLDIYR